MGWLYDPKRALLTRDGGDGGIDARAVVGKNGSKLCLIVRYSA